MRTKLLILILLIQGVCFGQAVPNTSTFSLQDVVNVTGGTSLDAAFTNSNATYFNLSYGSKTMDPKTLLGFQDYRVRVDNCPAIGDAFGGGIVAYIFEPGNSNYVEGKCRGLILSTTNFSAQWGCYGTNISGASNTIEVNAGQLNTNAILSGCSTSGIAARICSNLGTGWFLPSNNELANIMVEQIVLGRSDLTNGESYLTSTQALNVPSTRAYINTISGSSFLFNGSIDKNVSCTFRAVKYFDSTDPLPTPLLIATNSITGVSSTGFTANCEIANCSGLAIDTRGITYGTTPNSKENIVMSGTGCGSFSVSRSGLSSNTTYYVRAYALINSVNTYGNELSVTTLPAPTIAATLTIVTSTANATNQTLEYRITLSAPATSGVTFTIYNTVSYPGIGPTSFSVTVLAGSSYIATQYNYEKQSSTFRIDTSLGSNPPSGYSFGSGVVTSYIDQTY